MHCLQIFTVLLLLAGSIIHTLKILPEISHENSVNDYLQDLLSEQAGFEAGLNTLQNSVKKTTSATSTVDDLASKIKLLEDGIL